MKELIKKYTDQGFKIFPCNADKTPATSNGFKDAHSNYDLLCKQFFKQDMLIGLPCGSENHIVVIDIDIKDGRSVDELKEALKEYGEFPPTFEVETMSGGRHLYYRVENTNLSAHTHFFDKTLPVDLRGNNGYICAGDYKRYFPLDVDDIDDIRSLMSPLPDWIENYRKTDYVEPLEGVILPDTEIWELRSALACIDADDRDTWVKVGMALRSTGSLQAKGIFTEWSMKSDKFDPVDQEKKWKSFKPSDITIATIFHMAKEKGWVTTYEKTAPQIMSDEQITQKLSEIKSYERKPFPKELLNPPGFVGEVVEYMNSQAWRDQPILSVAASLAFAGALMGRRVQSRDGMRTNIYCMGIGETGCGKDNARACIKRIIEQCNDAKMEYFCTVENIASETSIYSALTLEASQIFLLDEIGIFFKTTQGHNANHLIGVPAALLKLFTSSDIRTSGKSYADTKKQIRINQPNLCIYGTATPGQFFDNLSKENLEQGLLGRMLVFESEDPRPPAKRHIEKKRPSADLIEKVKALFHKPTNCAPEGNVAGSEIVNPQIIPLTHEADEMIWKFTQEMDDAFHLAKKNGGVYEIYTRCVEIAKKVALIIAVGCHVYDDQPIIEALHMDYAIKLSRFLFESLHFNVENKISSSAQEKNLQKILQIIRSNGKISISDLTRKCQHLKSGERKDIIETLKEAKLIEEFLEDINGKKRRVFIAL